MRRRRHAAWSRRSTATRRRATTPSSIRRQRQGHRAARVHRRHVQRHDRLVGPGLHRHADRDARRVEPGDRPRLDDHARRRRVRVPRERRRHDRARRSRPARHDQRQRALPRDADDRRRARARAPRRRPVRRRGSAPGDGTLAGGGTQRDPLREIVVALDTLAGGIDPGARCDDHARRRIDNHYIAGSHGESLLPAPIDVRGHRRRRAGRAGARDRRLDQRDRAEPTSSCSATASSPRC